MFGVSSVLGPCGPGPGHRQRLAIGVRMHAFALAVVTCVGLLVAGCVGPSQPSGSVSAWQGAGPQASRRAIATVEENNKASTEAVERSVRVRRVPSQ
jgi:hypothetical protein